MPCASTFRGMTLGLMTLGIMTPSIAGINVTVGQTEKYAESHKWPIMLDYIVMLTVIRLCRYADCPGTIGLSIDKLKLKDINAAIHFLRH